MKPSCVLFIAMIATLVATIDAADARRGGRFFSGAARGGANALLHTPRKSYTPDVLTVDQLVDCLKTSELIDTSSNAIDAKSVMLTSKADSIDRKRTEIELREPLVNTRVKSEVDRFNGDVRQL